MPETPQEPPLARFDAESKSGKAMRVALERQLDDAAPDRTRLSAPSVPDHVLLRRIGSGGYGDVWLARNALGTLRAVKVVYRARFKEDRPYRLYLRGPIDLNGHDLEVYASSESAVEVTGVISGTGNILVNGQLDSTVGFNGPRGNTFQGTVTLRNPGDSIGHRRRHVRLNKESGVAVPVRLVLEKNTDVIFDRSEQIADDARVELRNGGTLELNGLIETIGGLELIHDPGNTNPMN